LELIDRGEWRGKIMNKDDCRLRQDFRLDPLCSLRLRSAIQEKKPSLAGTHAMHGPMQPLRIPFVLECADRSLNLR
jgi:hypothetical protein